MNYIIYAFESSNMAYLALNIVEENSIKARLVPLLPEIDAGCGLCLRFEEKYRKKVEEIIEISPIIFKERFRLIYKEDERKPEVINYDIP